MTPMVISSVIVKCLNGAENILPDQLRKIIGVSVEGVQNGDIILVLEGKEVYDTVQIIESEIKTLPGVAGVYPVYIAMEEDFPEKEV